MEKTKTITPRAFREYLARVAIALQAKEIKEHHDRIGLSLTYEGCVKMARDDFERVIKKDPTFLDTIKLPEGFKLSD